MEHIKKKAPEVLQEKIIYPTPAFSQLYNGVISFTKECYTVISVNYMDIRTFLSLIKNEVIWFLTFHTCHQIQQIVASWGIISTKITEVP